VEHRPTLPATVKLPPITRRHDENEQAAIDDLVHNPEITRPNAPLALAPDQFLGTGRAWGVGEQLDGRLDPRPGGGVQLA
jgi:hypothetical protein